VVVLATVLSATSTLLQHLPTTVCLSYLSGLMFSSTQTACCACFTVVSIQLTASCRSFTARSELLKVLFLAPSDCFCLCYFMYEVSRGSAERICTKFTQRTCLVPRSDEFEGQGHKVQKRHFLALSAACVHFMFGKTSLTSSFDLLPSSAGNDTHIHILSLCLAGVTAARAKSPP